MPGNINVRFTVQDAETVKEALDSLGKDGQAALAKLNAAGQQPSQGLRAISDVMADLKDRAVGLAVPLGPLGSGLIAMGPAGLAAAAGIGATVTAIKSMIDQANGLAEWAQQVRDLADVSGLSTTQIQGLTEAGAAFGLTTDTIGRDVERFSVQLDQVHQSTGKLYQSVEQINPALAQQMASTRDTASAWNLLSQAYSQATNAAQRSALTNAAFGRGGAASGLLLGAGDLDSLTASINGVDVATRAQIDHWATLKAEIEAASSAAQRNFASLFTSSVLEAELQFYDTMLELTRLLKEFQPPAWLSAIGSAAGVVALFGPLAPVLQLLKTGATALSGAPMSNFDVGKSQLTATMSKGGQSSAQASSIENMFFSANKSAVPDADALVAAYNQLQQKMSILGPAATSTEQIALENAKLTAEVAKTGNQYGDLKQRAMDYFTVQRNGADLQIKVENGAATATELLFQKQDELNQEVKIGKLSQDEANFSLQVYATKTLPDVIEKQKEWASSFPDLTKLAYDAGNLQKQLDSELSGALKGGTQDMIDMADGTVTLSQGLQNLTKRMGDAIMQALLMKSVVQPLASSLSGGLNSFLGLGSGGSGSASSMVVGANGPFPGLTFSAHGNPFLGGNVIPFASGGVVGSPTLFRMANGAGLMGEAGPEAVMPLQRLPGGDLGVKTSGGGGQTVVNIINNSGQPAQQQQRTDGNGNNVIDVVIGRVGQKLASGGFDKQLRGRFGMRPVTQRR